METLILGRDRTATPQIAASLRGRAAAAAIAAFLGALLIWAVGFSPMAAAHNAAHDTRHSLAFPCH